MLLEMNNFLGIGLIIYCTVFNYRASSDMPDDYVHIKQWVNFQVILMYVVIFLSLLMFLCMRSMQKKVTLNNDQKAGDKDE